MEDFMTQEQFMGFWKNLKAPLKDKWDNLTDGDLLQIDGNMVKFNEVLDLRYAEQKGAVMTWANRCYSHISGNYDGYDFTAKG
jgi:uncharacterized protein YjbJ (UPF0337 family)